MSDADGKTIELRVFGRLAEVFTQKNLPIPFILGLEKPVIGADLAAKLEIPRNEIEVMIVNGVVQALSHLIHPGDRVAFVPPGTPGPYRVLLGFIYKNKD